MNNTSLIWIHRFQSNCSSGSLDLISNIFCKIFKSFFSSFTVVFRIELNSYKAVLMLINNLACKILKSIKSLSARQASRASGSSGLRGYIDTGVKIIIGVVIGGVILAGLYALFNTTIIPTLTTKIQGMFSYSGT